MWFDPPNQPIKCASTCEFAPGYSSPITGCLLTFAGAALPFDCAANVAAALVLLPVSSVRVVVGTTVCVPATAVRAEQRIRTAITSRAKHASVRTRILLACLGGNASGKHQQLLTATKTGRRAGSEWR